MTTEYYLAQICLNGHVLDTTLEKSALQERSQRVQFCSSCGSATFVVCPKCDMPIQGEQVLIVTSASYFTGRHREQRLPRGRFLRPAFCHNCGKPYPWTEKALETARELIEETENYPEGDKDKLKYSLPDLLSDTPKTQVAIVRVKKLLLKSGEATASAFKEILVSVATEAVKKHLGL